MWLEGCGVRVSMKHHNLRFGLSNVTPARFTFAGAVMHAVLILAMVAFANPTTAEDLRSAQHLVLNAKQQ